MVLNCGSNKASGMGGVKDARAILHPRNGAQCTPGNACETMDLNGSAANGGDVKVAAVGVLLLVDQDFSCALSIFWSCLSLMVFWKSLSFLSECAFRSHGGSVWPPPPLSPPGKTVVIGGSGIACAGSAMSTAEAAVPPLQANTASRGTFSFAICGVL